MIATELAETKTDELLARKEELKKQIHDNTEVSKETIADFYAICKELARRKDNGDWRP